MRSARGLLKDLLAGLPSDRSLLTEYLVIIGLISVVVTLGFIFLGDAISDLISLISSGADRAG